LTQLLQGTGLTYRYLNDNGVSIVQINDTPPPNTSGAGPATPSVQPLPSTDGKEKEVEKGFLDRFRLAQADQGTPSGPSPVEKQKDQASKKKAEELEEIIVTGTRIPQTAQAGAQDVKVYTREKIEQSGQTTIADFLNTLPDVSTNIGESGIQTQQGITTVSLHGLPLGTTLVLLNGRRVEASGVGAAASGSDFFDLNNIPLAAVERIEVVSEGSSAIYGSDAIAGVVNIILKSGFDGIEASTKYGSASGTDESDTSIAWGKRWSDGALSVIGSYQTRGQLIGFDRAITANNDYLPFGGVDARIPECNPGEAFTLNGSPLPGGPPGNTASFAAVSANASGNPRQTGFMGTYGMLNQCSLNAYGSQLPATHRAGLLAQGNYNLSTTTELFTELLVSHVEELNVLSPPGLYGDPRIPYSQFTVSAANPYNPFGETVGVSELFPSLGSGGYPLDTVFLRALLGARGEFLSGWHWEVAAWDSQDRSRSEVQDSPDATAIQNALNSTNPKVALNPFIAGLPASSQSLQSLFFTQLARYYGQEFSADGVVHGSLWELPSGSIKIAAGGEYQRDKLASDQVNVLFEPPNTRNNFYRTADAVFAEARVPIVGSHQNPQAAEILALTLAGRIDHYDDFGNKSTPQLGIEWRPWEVLLVRGTYGRTFKAPSLFELHAPQTTFVGFVFDPQIQQEVSTNLVSGGNSLLRPETGRSSSVGLVYSSSADTGPQLSITQWNIVLDNSVQSLPPQVLIDNPNLFPGTVIRDSAGVITQVNDVLQNFGETNVAGVDLQASYKIPTPVGQFTPSLGTTTTYHYTSAATPGFPATDRVSIANDDNNWAPRWKGTAALSWKLGPYSANVDGRYVGRYQDYDSTQMIGNFWLYDANLRYTIGGAHGLQNAYVALGGVNIFNRLPQFSNYSFGAFGYDPAESDIRGRFLYVQLGVRW
jgi:iron complex outermembrane receptor protein